MNDYSTSSIADMLRANPLGAAMIGAGLFWMFAGAKTGEAMLGAARAISDSGASLTPSRIADSAADMTSAVGEAARKSAATVSENASAMMRGEPAQNAFAAFDTVRDSLGRMFAAQPLMIAATGLAVGAAIAATLPSTQVETSALGDKADALKQQATDFVARGAQEAKAVLSDLASTAQQQAQAHGVDPAALADKAQEAARDIRDVGKTLGKEAGLL